MCGRFTNRYSWREIKELYDLTTPYLTSNFPPCYNVAPTQQSFIVQRVTKYGDRASVQRNASERRASLEKDDVQVDPVTLPGKADTAG